MQSHGAGVVVVLVVVLEVVELVVELVEVVVGQGQGVVVVVPGSPVVLVVELVVVVLVVVVEVDSSQVLESRDHALALVFQIHLQLPEQPPGPLGVAGRGVVVVVEVVADAAASSAGC